MGCIMMIKIFKVFFILVFSVLVISFLMLSEDSALSNFHCLVCGV